MVMLPSFLPIALSLVLVTLFQPVVHAENDANDRALLPDEVLESSSRYYPGILKSLAVERATQGRNVAAQGAFDLVFESEGYNYVNGFYDGAVVGGSVTQPLRSMNANVYGGYDVSRGDFPVYEDESFTSRLGKVKVGVLFSLLRDRVIDERRFRENDSLLEFQQAELDVLLTRIGVQQKALIAYWRWVTAGRQLQVYKDLLQLAKDREHGLEVKIREGKLAQIYFTENRQNITRRQALTLTAERSFRVATNALSLYYRNENGKSLFVKALRLPTDEELNETSAPLLISEIDSMNSLERRPELLQLKTAMQRAEKRAELSKNDLKPRFDLNFELSSGLGNQGEGGPSRDENDVIVGFDFSVPFERRKAKGKLAEAEADLEALKQESRILEDQLDVEMRNILLDLDVMKQQVELANLEVEQSEKLRLAEFQRFQQGASDFFLMNVREETAADARIRYFAAQLDKHVARVNYDAATVNLAQLGLY